MYSPQAWYWKVAGRKDVYSSERGAYVPESDPAYAKWLAAGNRPTAIGSEQDLVDVFRSQHPGGWPKLARADAARAALARSDVTVLRCVESGLKVPKAWIAYREKLRAIAGGADADPLPAAPSYPSAK
jgi:hypothetical protein